MAIYGRMVWPEYNRYALTTGRHPSTLLLWRELNQPRSDAATQIFIN